MTAREKLLEKALKHVWPRYHDALHWRLQRGRCEDGMCPTIKKLVGKAPSHDRPR
jgi:hypothetical protein